MNTQAQNIEVTRYPQTVRIEYERETPDDQDSSPNDYLFQDPDYKEEDQARLDAFNAGDWCMIGVRAKATILVPIGQGSFCSYELTSAGVWAVESDSGEDYLNELYREEINSLEEALKAIGHSLSTDSLSQAVVSGKP